MSWMSTLLGRPLTSNEKETIKIGVFAGVPAMGLDGLTSSAYGPEAALTMLHPLGSQGRNYVVPVILTILILLAIVYFSYRQTISAYPVNGGSYTVARENLGVWPGLLAAAALLLDYILNVAVGISAGVAALVSTFPALHSYTVLLCLAVLIIITLLNLRGTAEAGVAFSIPTYSFILCMAAMLAIGVVKAILSGGIAFLARTYHVGAMHQDQPGYQSVLSQLTLATVGHSWFYYLTMATILATLSLSANTSFVDFPRLCRMIARDDFLPRGFTVVGRRLVYSVGIIFLAVTAGLLLVIFGGITDRLIPLFAVGAFSAFTLSQTGMVFHWRKELRKIPNDTPQTASAKRGIHLRLWINGIGATATGSALVVILIAKLAQGAWIVDLAVPMLLTLFTLIHRHYQRLNSQTSTRQPLELDDNQPPIVLVPIRGWNRLTAKALRFSMWLSTDIIALHLNNLSGEEGQHETERIQQDWQNDVETPAAKHGVPKPRLISLPCPYRRFIQPMLKQIDQVKKEFPSRTIAVVIPEVVEIRWWQFLLHSRKPARLHSALLKRGDHQVIVINVPWYIKE